MRNVTRVFARLLATVTAVGALTMLAPAPAAAQSTIFNIPSTDTVAPKKVYFEFDYLLQLPAPDEGQFQVFTPRVVFGAAPNLEVGLNVGVTHVNDGGNTTYTQPNAKYKFYANDDKGLAASAGFIYYLGSDDADDFGLIYGNFSKKIAQGSRFTFGAYGAPSADGDGGGVMLGAEVPVAGKLSVVADWFSGKNFFGYFTPGISIALPHNALFNIGYSIGNDRDIDNNNALFMYYGIVLN